MEDESKQMRPILERFGGSGADRFILAGLIVPAPTFHASPDEGGRVPKLNARQVTVHKGVPASEEVVNFIEHEFGEGGCIGAAAHFLEGQELSYEVRPAKLPDAFVIGAVCRGVIARYDALEDLTEHRGKDGRAATGSDMEINKKRGYEDPEGSALTPGFPARFVDIEVVVLDKGFSDLFGRFFERVAYAVERFT